MSGAPEWSAQPAPAPLIAAAQVDVRRAGELVLRDVSLAVGAGEIVTLIGPNGSGKTTFIRVLLGLQRPERGTVQRARDLVIGYVPQRFELDPVLPLTVRRFLGMSGQRELVRIDAVLAEVGLEGLGRRPLSALSGGELRRVLIARALLRAPSLLVLDEPVQQVDFTGQLDLYALIRRIRRERGCAVLLASHDLHIVMSATDRVLCLNGHVCCSGTPETVSQHPEYIALFGPRAAGDLAVYTHSHDHAHGPHGEIIALKEGTPPTVP